MTARVGLRVGHTFTKAWGVLSLEGRADGVKEFETDQQLVSINFINDPFNNNAAHTSSSYTVLRDQPDESFFVWGVNLSYAGPRGISGFVDYQSAFGLSGIKVSDVSAGIRVQWQF